MENNLAPLAKLRLPFPANQISKLPKPYKSDSQKGNCKECGGYHGLPAMHLDYVGHAALTDRLLDVDPGWTWEPLALDANGLPALDKDGGLWIKLTICGVTRLGYGDAQGKTGCNASKERIGDALRNAAMRFGAALDLWHKGELHIEEEPAPPPKLKAVANAKPEYDPIKGGDTTRADELEAAINSAADLSALHAAWAEAYRYAQQQASDELLTRFTKAKDAKKDELAVAQSAPVAADQSEEYFPE